MSRNWLSLAVFGLALIALPSANGGELIVNGSFETGTLAAWSAQDEAGGSGSFFIQTGTASPLNGFTVPPPPDGIFAAMTDQFGPGSHVLYQDFAVPASVASATLSFAMYINSASFDFVTGPDLNPFIAANQQARVDVMTSTSGAFSVGAGDVLQNIYQTAPGDPLVAGYFTVSVNLTALFQAHLGETLRIRFAEVDNQGFFNLGVDAVSLDVSSVPEPTTLASAGIAALFGLAAARKGRRRRAA